MPSVIDQIFADVHVTRLECAGGPPIADVEVYGDTRTLDVDLEGAYYDLSELLCCGQQTFRSMVDGHEVELTLTVRSWNADGTIVVDVSE